MLGLLYDVHGNLLALEAVLADAEQAGVERWLLGGDYAAFGGWPQETVGRLRDLEHAHWIRGNADRWLADASDVPDAAPIHPALEACREALGTQVVAELVALPAQLTFDDALFCHASPRNDMESFGAEPVPGDASLLEGAPVDRVVFGHTHIPFVRGGPGGVELINPGSVGIPLDGDPRASYAVAHDDGRVEHRRVGYDHEAAAARLGQRFDGASWTEVFALRIRTAGLT